MTTAPDGAVLTVTPATGSATYVMTAGPMPSTTTFALGTMQFLMNDASGGLICDGQFSIENDIVILNCANDGTSKKILRDGTLVAYTTAGVVDPANSTATGDALTMQTGFSTVESSSSSATEVTNADGSVTITHTDGVVVTVGTDGVETTQYPAGG